jgi:hypothetical protein
VFLAAALAAWRLKLLGGAGDGWEFCVEPFSSFLVFNSAGELGKFEST